MTWESITNYLPMSIDYQCPCLLVAYVLVMDFGNGNCKIHVGMENIPHSELFIDSLDILIYL